MALAIARAAKVDFLLLDEPTNHLDLAAIARLERELPNFASTMIFVSHDRQFIDRVATRVVELGSFYDGSLLSRPGGYGDFVTARHEWLAQQAAAAESMRNRLRREQDWLSRTPKARTTKSQARIDAAGDLASALADNQQRQRQATKSASVSMTATGRHANELIVLENVGKNYDDRDIIGDFSITVAPGDRIVLLGANGSENDFAASIGATHNAGPWFGKNRHTVCRHRFLISTGKGLPPVRQSVMFWHRVVTWLIYLTALASMCALMPKVWASIASA